MCVHAICMISYCMALNVTIKIDCLCFRMQMNYLACITCGPICGVAAPCACVQSRMTWSVCCRRLCGGCGSRSLAMSFCCYFSSCTLCTSDILQISGLLALRCQPNTLQGMIVQSFEDHEEEVNSGTGLVPIQNFLVTHLDVHSGGIHAEQMNMLVHHSTSNLVLTVKLLGLCVEAMLSEPC